MKVGAQGLQRYFRGKYGARNHGLRGQRSAIVKYEHSRSTVIYYFDVLVVRFGSHSRFLSLFFFIFQ